MSLALLIFTAACGSAVEPGGAPLSAAGSSDAAGGEGISLASYQVYVDPMATDIRYLPNTAAGALTQSLFFSKTPNDFLGQTLANGSVAISNASTTHYDLGGNTIRLQGSGSGLCLQNVESGGKHLQGLTARFTLMPSSLTVGEGGSGITGGFAVDYGDVANGLTSCRPLALTNTNNTRYSFSLNFDATLTGTTPATYISNVSPTALVFTNGSATLTINGSGFVVGGRAPQVLINGESVQNNGGQISYTNTQIIVTLPSNFVGTSGQLSVQPFHSPAVSGPYLTNPTKLSYTATVGAGQAGTRPLLLYTYSGLVTFDSSSCLGAAMPEDAELINGVSLSTSGSVQTMSYLGAPGANKTIYAMWDFDNSGSFTVGDYYAFSSHQDWDPGVNNLDRTGTSSMVGGAGFTCATDDTHNVSCWGRNDSGALGDGTTTNSNAPVKIQNAYSRYSVAKGISEGHSCSLQNDSLQCWGANGVGQLGDGTTTSSNVPVNVDGMTSGVQSAAVGTVATCAIQNQALYCWGNNSSGQLGIGSTKNSNKPQAVIGMDNNVTAVAMGASHACAVQDGSLFCWGSNALGQLGTGDNRDSLTPVAVTGLPSGNVVGLATGTNHTCATVGQQLYCWGSNSNAQIGDDSGKDQAAPVAITAMTSVSMVSAGSVNSCVINGGRAYCWGDNSLGQIGDNTTTNRTTPTQVTGLTNPTEIVSAHLYSCAKDSGRMKCWGSGGLGNLGVGDNSDHYTPTNVTHFGVESAGMAITTQFSACPF